MSASFYGNITKVKQLIEVLEKFDPEYELRVLDNFKLYGINTIIPEFKDKIILVPNKSLKKVSKTDANKN